MPDQPPWRVNPGAIFAMAQNGTFAFCARRRVSTGRGSATDGAGAPCASLTGAAIGFGLHKLKGDRKAQWTGPCASAFVARVVMLMTSRSSTTTSDELRWSRFTLAAS